MIYIVALHVALHALLCNKISKDRKVLANTRIPSKVLGKLIVKTGNLIEYAFNPPMHNIVYTLLLSKAFLKVH